MALSALNWLLALLVIVGEATADQQCFPQRTSSFKFHLTSYSNQTGFRFFKVGLESEASSEGPVTLDVNHWTGMCGGVETVGVQVDFAIPIHPPTEAAPQRSDTSATTTTAGVPQTTATSATTTTAGVPQTTATSPATTTAGVPQTTATSPATTTAGVPQTTATSPTTTTAGVPQTTATSATTTTAGVPQTTATSPATTTAGVPQTTPSPSAPMPTPAVSTGKPVSSCWPGYELFKGVGCYKEVNETISWWSARDSCAAEGSFLAVPESQEQMSVILQIRDRDSVPTWVGIHKTDGQWASVQGSEFPLNSSFWRRGEPQGGRDCGFMAWTRELLSAPCYEIIRYICQQP